LLPKTNCGTLRPLARKNSLQDGNDRKTDYGKFSDADIRCNFRAAGPMNRRFSTPRLLPFVERSGGSDPLLCQSEKRLDLFQVPPIKSGATALVSVNPEQIG
jgi:hypothetical protein